MPSLLSFGKQKLQLKAQGPVPQNFRLFHVVKALKLRVHGLLADPEYLAEAAADGYHPGVVAVVASQLAVIIGELTRCQPFGRL